jgi:sulfur carrier protein ThiS
MSIRIQLSPFLRKYVSKYSNDTGIVLGSENPRNVDKIIAELNIPFEEVVTIMVNGYLAKHNSVVKTGDSVTLAKVIGGG